MATIQTLGTGHARPPRAAQGGPLAARMDSWTRAA